MATNKGSRGFTLKTFDITTEATRGQGIYYELKKRIRLKPGSYTLGLKHEEGKPAEIRLSLEGGRLHTLNFKPIYGPVAAGRIKNFRYGIKYYKISLDGAEILTE